MGEGWKFSFFFSSRRRHTIWTGDWSSDVCSSDLLDDHPAHQGHEPRGDRQAQSGAAVLPRGRCVLLLEGSENLLLLVRRDANAGVGNFEAQRHFLAQIRISKSEIRNKFEIRMSQTPNGFTAAFGVLSLGFR